MLGFTMLVNWIFQRLQLQAFQFGPIENPFKRFRLPQQRGENQNRFNSQLSKFRHAYSMLAVVSTALLILKGHTPLQITSHQYFNNLIAEQRQHHACLGEVHPSPSTAAISHNCNKISARAAGFMSTPLQLNACSRAMKLTEGSTLTVVPAKLCPRGEHLGPVTGRATPSRTALLVQLTAHTSVTPLND